MSFEVDAAAYGRFMGRFSEPLAAEFVALLGLDTGQQVLDVGCGPGALTAELIGRLGPGAVAAVDPSEPFVAAIRARFPGLDVRRASAEHLPFPNAGVDLAVAQLVVPFMADPVAGLSEMARVTRDGGLVAACVWDHAGDGGPLSVFWRAVRDIDQAVTDESGLAGAREGHLAELFAGAGLRDIQSTVMTVRVGFATMSDWWDPFTLGVGPAGAHVARLDAAKRHQLRARAVELLPPAPFEMTASAWTALGRVR